MNHVYTPIDKTSINKAGWDNDFLARIVAGF